MEIDENVKAYLAGIIYDAGRAQDSADILLELLEAKYTFQNSDAQLFISVWSDLISPLRIAILNMKDDLGEQSSAIKELKNVLNEKLNQIINILQDIFIPLAQDELTQASYIKKLADFQRYKIECYDGEEKKTLSNESQKNYKKTLTILDNFHENIRNELNISTELNYAILLADYLDQRQTAEETLTRISNELENSISKYPEKERSKIQDYIDIMKENLARWNAKDNEN
ncbi:14-3-3 protein [Histomonas meleagridis]|uniref:14-3-3 protein n=1 Tax=Histomonas meleagridis TaxID=135588 RepID=UPI00355A767B|nr:14-3-3 protein [Histomonas meleagridis]KAH0804011.1 14-3-3 protein [Histomonas meleagridis]